MGSCHKRAADSVMTFYLLNATSLAKTNAVQLLSLDIKEHCPHVALVTETWFTNKHHTSCLSIPNYTLYRRVNRKGGGVCAYVCDDIKCVLLKYDIHADCIEIMWLKCYFSCQVYYVACCYHPLTHIINLGYSLISLQMVITFYW